MNGKKGQGYKVTDLVTLLYIEKAPLVKYI